MSNKKTTAKASQLERLRQEDTGSARTSEAKQWIDDHKKCDEIKELIQLFREEKEAKRLYMGWDRFAKMLQRDYGFPFRGAALEKCIFGDK